MSTRWRVNELAARLGAAVRGNGDVELHGVATLGSAGAGELSFLSNRRYRSQLATSAASAVILTEEFLNDCPCVALVMDNPYLGYAHAATLMNPRRRDLPGIHPTAVIHERASVDASACIGAGVVVDAGARIAERVFIGPGCVIGPDCEVGAETRLAANVTLCAHVSIGERGLMHPGVVLGADGFGIANDDGIWVKVPQLGNVMIGNDVEIGANTTVDRGALEDTVIEDGVKLDNQIQVGHNVRIGAHTAIAACVAIGGSARIGRRCTIGGAASLAGHLEIADDVHLTATSAVPNSIPQAGVYSSGMPIQDNRSWRRNVIRMRQLDDMAKTLKALRARLDALEGRDA